MAQEERQKPIVVALNEKQAAAVVDGLKERGAIFFTDEQLQASMAQFGPQAKVSDVQKAALGTPRVKQ